MSEKSRSSKSWQQKICIIYMNGKSVKNEKLGMGDVASG